jgi:hypothetical protein
MAARIISSASAACRMLIFSETVRVLARSIYGIAGTGRWMTRKSLDIMTRR